MALVRRIARPLLAAPFILEGVRTASQPEREIDVYPQAFEAVDSALAKTSTPDFLDARTMGWAGRKRIWELSGEERMQEIQSILTDAGLLGGVLLAVVDHDGRPSLGYQVNKFVERSKKNAAAKQRELEKKVDAVGKQAKKRVDATQKKLASARG